MLKHHWKTCSSPLPTRERGPAVSLVGVGQAQGFDLLPRIATAHLVHRIRRNRELCQLLVLLSTRAGIRTFGPAGELDWRRDGHAWRFDLQRIFATGLGVRTLGHRIPIYEPIHPAANHFI